MVTPAPTTAPEWGPVTPVAPGWYADPTHAMTLRYWNGSGWTAHTAPMTTPLTRTGVPGGLRPLVPKPRWNLGWFNRIAGILLMTLLLLMTSLDVMDVAFTGWRIWLLSVDAVYFWQIYDAIDWTRHIELARVIGCAVVAVVWLVWQWPLAMSDRVPAGSLRMHPAWHGLGWLIPVLNLWAGLINVADVDAALECPLREDGIPRRHRITRLHWIWWLSWLASIATLPFSISVIPYTFLDVIPRGGAWIELTMGAIQLTASVSAVLVVLRIQGWFAQQRAAGIAPIAPY